MPGLAGGLPADRPARLLQLLRGVHPHHRLDVQPARQVVQGMQAHPVAAGRSPRSTTCSARTSGGRTTAASATRTPASSTTWSTRRPRSSASTCRPTPTHSCRDRSLLAQPQLRQRRRGRQAAGPVADHGPGHQALHRGPRHLGLGQQRQGQRPGRGHGLLRRRTDPGNAGGGRACCATPAGAEGAWSTS